MALHSSTLAWKIPWTEEPGRLQSMGLLGVGHDWAISLSLFFALEKEMATHICVLAWRIPGEPGGLLSIGSHRVRNDWSDLAAAEQSWQGDAHTHTHTHSLSLYKRLCGYQSELQIFLPVLVVMAKNKTLCYMAFINHVNKAAWFLLEPKDFLALKAGKKKTLLSLFM